MNILVSAASQHGGTHGIAVAIASVLRDRGLEVALIAPEDVESVEAYDAVVLGSAVYTGHWLQAVKELVGRDAAALATRPVWLFSSGPVGDPARKLTQQMDVDPVDLAEISAATHARGHRRFAGKLDRGELHGLQRASLLVFRGLEGDFRDWAEIDRWAGEIADSLQAAGPSD